MIEIYADYPNISFDVKLDGIAYTVRMSGGQWEIFQDGGARPLGRGSLHWTEALKRSLSLTRLESLASDL